MVKMAKSRTTFVKTQRIQGFYTLLTSAACEWFLLFLLLINAIISYLLTTFARYCNLQTPCVLCSRIDHVINGDKQKLEWYQNLICNNHRSEVSSLVWCHIHDKVSDGHEMCDDCLMSVAPEDKTHSKTQRLLLGKLGPDRGEHGSQSLLPNRDMLTISMGLKPCSCCGKLWNSRLSSQRSLLLKSPRTYAFKPDFHLPHIYRNSFRKHHKNLKKISEEPSCLGRCCSNSAFNYVEYTEVKLASDSEFEFTFFDDDEDIASQNHENIEARNNLMPRFTVVVDSNPIKPHIPSSETKPSILFPSVKPNISNQPDFNSKWQQPNQKSLSSEMPELISLSEVSLSFDAMDIPSQEPEGSGDDNDTQVSDFGYSSKNHEEAIEETGTIALASTETAPSGTTFASLSRRNDDSCNVNELPITNKEREAPSSVHEHRTPTEINGVNEEPKQSHSPNAFPHGSSMSSVVPINHVNAPEIQTNTSSSNGIQELKKAPSIEHVRRSLDGCNVSENERESIVDQLKQQVEHDKKCISDLYMELEEERNAAAIAASQSMAMITRLQEEKAGLHMEALQYLRMMDGQVEYDGEELEKAYDLLAEKEREIQDLEAELEFYRLNMEDEPMGHNMQNEGHDLKGENITVQNFSLPPITTSSNSKLAELSLVTGESMAHETLLEFEEDKLYISNCLTSLEKKLRRISNNGISFNMPNDRPENSEESKSDQQGSSNSEKPQLDGQKDKNVLSIKEDYDIPNGSIMDQDGSIASKSEICPPREETNHSVSIGQRKNVDLVSIENEISDLHERLEALEANHDLLERILHSLRDDNDGLQFIRDIVHQLHELRKLGSKIR